MLDLDTCTKEDLLNRVEFLEDLLDETEHDLELLLSCCVAKQVFLITAENISDRHAERKARKEQK